MEMQEISRKLKRVLDGYMSSRRAFLVVTIVLGFLLYFGPSMFRWLRQKTPIMIDPNIGCVATLLDPFTLEASKFDASIRKSYEPSETSFLPYTGNGKLGLSVEDYSHLYIMSKRSLSLPLPFQPLIHVSLPGTSSQEGVAVSFTTGIVHRFYCFSQKRKTIGVSQQVYAHRTIPAILLQSVKVNNPLSDDITVVLNQIGVVGDADVHTQLKTVQGNEATEYNLHIGKVAVPDSENLVIVFAIAAVKVPDSVTVTGRGSQFLHFGLVLHHSQPITSNEVDHISKELGAMAEEDMKKVLAAQPVALRKSHVQAWKQLWNTGFGISYSRAQGTLNGDKINATLYYVLSQTRALTLELTTTSSRLQELESWLSYPDMCYRGHHTLQASTLWSELKTEKEVNNVVALWLLTLEKQGCHNLLLSGSEGVMQAMVLSFGAFKFNNHHLEFATHPKDLHRDYFFRRLSYGNSTHLNISVVVGENNKAVIYVALDRSDRDYYACDGGCLDPPIKLRSETEQFPVKLTEPVTAILYITSDKEHMEDLKHTIHVKEVVEAPAHEHHVLALHRHGHQLGGLPALFWVSIAFLIVVFHLFLIKLIYNEYCATSDKIRGRYVV